MFDMRWVIQSFYLFMENIYVQFEGMVFVEIVGIPVGTNCALLIADLFLYCYKREFCLTVTNLNGMTV